MWTGIRRTRQYNFIVIEEVMQQKAPGVPNNIQLKNQQSASVVRKRVAANFFKTTFSSRSKAVPTAGHTCSAQETTTIGSAETKPVTRNRPRTVPQAEQKIKRRNSDRTLNLRPEKPLEPTRPLRAKPTTPDPGEKPVQKDENDGSTVLKNVRKAPPPFTPVPKTADSILPPSLKPKVSEKVKLKREKYVNNNSVWTNANILKGEKKPLISIRGPSQGKQESTLKGAPSVSSLDSKHHKVAPAREKTLKIFGSKEKLHKAHKKKDLGNNNAVLEDPELQEGLEVYEDGQVGSHDYGSAEELGARSVDERGSQECISLPVMLNADHMPGFQEVELRPRVPSEASLTSGARELESLRRQLEASMMERAQLTARVDELLERAGEADRLRSELERLKLTEAEREATLERLADENGTLRARLRGVAHSPLSDSEKRQLLLAPAPRRMHSSAPASIALAHNGEGDSGEASTPEWDKHSSSSLSEVSVACLQDRILQMEEHHYSTSEELQATLAELADLQSQLADAHADNERLADEKQVLLESLCRQTEKLEDSRTKVDTLQEMLMREGVEPETVVSGDADQQLFALLKVSQEERRLLLSKQEQLEADLTLTKTALEDKTKENETLTEKIRSLESSVERLESERTHWEQEAGSAREAAAARQHQITTLGDLLEAAKAQLAGAAEGAAQAEAAATAAARREADAAAARAHTLAERLAHAQRQLDRAHSDARKLHDDALVSRNNAKSTISELEFQLEQLRQEKAALQGELQTLQETTSELQIQVQVATDEKLALMSRAGEALARTAELERQLQDARTRLAQVTRDRERDETEWKQFQSDLLMTVRVANDFKTEAQRELERLVSENKASRDRIRLLEDQIHSMKAMPPRTEDTPPPPLLSSASLQDIMATAASHRRTKGVSRQDSRLSVKSLIESIENAAKAAKNSPATTPVTEWPQVQTSVGVTTTTNNIKNGMADAAPPSTNGISASNFSSKPPAPRSNRPSPITTESSATGAAMTNMANMANMANMSSMANMPDEQRALATLQQKAIESFVRRNSYGDICERKDPLNALQVKNGGSKRNALLKWCQQKTLGYNNIDITNFSSSWNDGMALCALLHSYLGEACVPYATLAPHDKRTNFSVAFAAAESVGIPTTLNIQDMIQQERPDWQQVMAYVTSIYKHFET